MSRILCSKSIITTAQARARRHRWLVQEHPRAYSWQYLRFEDCASRILRILPACEQCSMSAAIETGIKVRNVYSEKVYK